MSPSAPISKKAISKRCQANGVGFFTLLLYLWLMPMASQASQNQESVNEISPSSPPALQSNTRHEANNEKPDTARPEKARSSNRLTVGIQSKRIQHDSAADFLHENTPDFVVPDTDLLALSDEIKRMLDQQIAPITSKKQRFLALHDALYKPFGLNLMYSPYGTYSANDTFRLGYGNCVSHANLFVAAARYVGLKANFQSVDIPPAWRPRKGFYELPGHVNVKLTLGRHIATVEFDSTIFEEYEQADLRTKIISDRQAKAEFYNNHGVQALADDQFYRAIAYFKKSIDTYKKLDISWSNLGVAYKQLGQYENAEQAYRQALAINRFNKPAMKNLYVLYTDLGDEKNAKSFRRIVERYARKNPYYLERLAQSAIEKSEYKQAQKLIKKAIKIFNAEPSFYHTQALAYYQQEKFSLAQQALQRAEKLAQGDEQLRYSQKLKYLGKL